MAGADFMAVVAAVITGNRRFKFPGSLKNLETEERQMQRTELNAKHFHWGDLPKLATIALKAAGEEKPGDRLVGALLLQ